MVILNFQTKCILPLFLAIKIILTVCSVKCRLLKTNVLEANEDNCKDIYLIYHHYFKLFAAKFDTVYLNQSQKR